MPTQFTGRSLMGMLAPKHLAIPFSSPAIASRLTIPLASLPPHFAAFAAKSGLPISAASSLNQQFNPDSLPPDLRTMLQLQGHP